MSTELAKQIWYSSNTTSDITSTSVTDIFSVTAIATGVDLWIGLLPDPGGSSDDSYIGSSGNKLNSNQNYCESYFRIIRDNTTVIGRFYLGYTDDQSALPHIFVPVGSIWCVDNPSPGSRTYKLQCYCTAGASQQDTYVNNAVMIVREL